MLFFILSLFTKHKLNSSLKLSTLKYKKKYLALESRKLDILLNKKTFDMKKEFRTLTFLSMALVLVYLLFQNFQENMKKDDLNIMYDEKQIVDSLDKKSLLEENIIRLTFDIVRISKHGDAVLAGKSEPNIYIELLNNRINHHVFL